MNNYEVDRMIDRLLCECYAYVDDRRASIEQDHLDDGEDYPVAHEERALNNQIIEAISELRKRYSQDVRYPL